MKELIYQKIVNYYQENDGVGITPSWILTEFIEDEEIGISQEKINDILLQLIQESKIIWQPGDHFIPNI